jgi:hypothetical protein
MDHQMNFKSRYAGSSSGKTASSTKNWVIGWTTDEAKAAAQRKGVVKQPSGNPGMFGALVPTGNR